MKEKFEDQLFPRIVYYMIPNKEFGKFVDVNAIMNTQVTQEMYDYSVMLFYMAHSYIRPHHMTFDEYVVRYREDLLNSEYTKSRTEFIIEKFFVSSLDDIIKMIDKKQKEISNIKFRFTEVEYNELKDQIYSDISLF